MGTNKSGARRDVGIIRHNHARVSEAWKCLGGCETQRGCQAEAATRANLMARAKTLCSIFDEHGTACRTK